MKKPEKEELRSLGIAALSTVVGSVLCALATNLFFVPSHLLSSGFTGLSLLFNYTLGWNLSLVYFLLNVPLFFLVWKMMGRRSLWICIFGTVVFSLAVEFIGRFELPFESDLTTVLLGGAIYGAGVGIILRGGGLTGGMDIISRLLNKYFAVSMGLSALVFNAVLFFIFAFIDGIDIAVLTLAAVIVSTVVNNYVNEGIDKRRALFIVTEKEDEISAAILSEVGRGVTVLDARGAYTGEPNHLVYSVVSSWQVPRIKGIVNRIDPAAFMSVSEVAGVYGKGRGFHRMKEE